MGFTMSTLNPGVWRLAKYVVPFAGLVPLAFGISVALDKLAPEKAQAALSCLPKKDRRALTVAEIMRAVYSRILQRIERPDHAVFGPRVRLSTSNRLALAAGVWLRSRFS